MLKYRAKMDPIPAASISGALAVYPEQLVASEEQLFQKKIQSACDAIERDQLHLILLTGPSASGKTTTAKKIALELEARGKKVSRISLDNFYRPAAELPRWEDGYQNYESVEGLDIPRFEQFVEELFKTGSSRLPLFDFTTGTRREKEILLSFDEHTYVIFEGIHALNPFVTEPLAPHPSLKIYISVHSDFIGPQEQVLLGARDLRLTRRLLRDFYHRTTPAEETLQMWDYVLRGEDLYIRPFRQHADMHINSTHAYEPFLYRDQLLQLLKNTSEESPYLQTIQRLRNSIASFSPISSQLIPQTSLIQEFLPNQT